MALAIVGEDRDQPRDVDHAVDHRPPLAAPADAALEVIEEGVTAVHPGGDVLEPGAAGELGPAQAREAGVEARLAGTGEREAELAGEHRGIVARRGRGARARVRSLGRRYTPAVPRTLAFRYRGAELPLVPEKLDRAKLYGSVEVEALDEAGRRCELATLSSDGKTLIGRGGKAMGFLSADGRWLDRAALRPVDPDGDPLEPVPSSFSAPVVLDQRATVEEYLAHNIKAVYALSGEDPALAELAAELEGGAIYTFPYSFRGGIVADVGFLLAGQDGDLFLAVGQPTHLHFLGLDQLPVYEDEEAAGEDDELDFGML
jgi:hypothetical protein